MQQYEIFLKNLRSTTSKNKKVEYIKLSANVPIITNILIHAYDPLLVYYLTPESIKITDSGKLHANDDDYSSFLDILDQLYIRKYTGNMAIELVYGFISKYNIESQIEMLNILKKDIRANINIKLINEAIPGLIPEFNCALANKYDFNSKKLPFKINIVSRKLDGVRCLAIKNNNNIHFMSRSGKEYFTLDKIYDILAKCPIDNVVFDGEVCIMNSGVEDFRSIIKEIRKKDHTIKNPMYYIFDLIDVDEFINGIGKIPFTKRLERLNKLHEYLNTEYTSILKQTIVNDLDMLMNIFKNTIQNNGEGLILRNGDAVYEGKRTNNMLKIKEMNDIELNVVGAVEGNGKYKNMLGYLICSYKNNTIDVGSGYTDDERREIWNKYITTGTLPSKITVQYFEEIEDENGNKSLRFPVFKGVRDYE